MLGDFLFVSAAFEGFLTTVVTAGLGMGPMGEFLFDTGWEMSMHGASLDEAVREGLVGAAVGRAVEVGPSAVAGGIRVSAGAAVDGIRWAKNGGFGQIANSMGRRVRDAGDSIRRAWRGTDADGGTGRSVSNVDPGRVRTARPANAEASIDLRQRREWNAPPTMPVSTQTGNWPAPSGGPPGSAFREHYNIQRTQRRWDIEYQTTITADEAVERLANHVNGEGSAIITHGGNMQAHLTQGNTTRIARLDVTSSRPGDHIDTFGPHLNIETHFLDTSTTPNILWITDEHFPIDNLTIRQGD